MQSARSIATPRSSLNGKDALVNGIRVNEVVELFETLGYECGIDAELKGMSGTEHKFDIIAKLGSDVVVVDIVAFRSSILDTPASDYEISDQLSMAGIRMRVKAWDCRCYQKIIIHLSSHLSVEGEQMSEHDPLRKFLGEFDIKFVRSVDVQGAAKQIKALLSEVEVA